MRVVSGTHQLTLSLEPGLTQRFPTLRRCLQHVVLSDPRGAKSVAADCDLSDSELSRRLSPSPGDPRSLDIDLFVEILASTDDFTPIRWLIARFLPDDGTRQAVALQKLERLLPEIVTAIQEAKEQGEVRARDGVSRNAPARGQRR